MPQQHRPSAVDDQKIVHPLDIFGMGDRYDAHAAAAARSISFAMVCPTAAHAQQEAGREQPVEAG